MKNESNSRSAFFNLRISISLLVVLPGAFLALTSPDAISNGTLKEKGSPPSEGTIADKRHSQQDPANSPRRNFDQHGNRASTVGLVHRHAAKHRQAKTVGGGAWSSLGPPGGDVFDAAVSTTNPDIALAGLAPDGSVGGTLYRSSDGGNTWSEEFPVTVEIPGLRFQLWMARVSSTLSLRPTAQLTSARRTVFGRASTAVSAGQC